MFYSCICIVRQSSGAYCPSLFPFYNSSFQVSLAEPSCVLIVPSLWKWHALFLFHHFFIIVCDAVFLLSLYVRRLALCFNAPGWSTMSFIIATEIIKSLLEVACITWCRLEQEGRYSITLFFDFLHWTEICSFVPRVFCLRCFCCYACL